MAARRVRKPGAGRGWCPLPEGAAAAASSGNCSLGLFFFLPSPPPSLSRREITWERQTGACQAEARFLRVGKSDSSSPKLAIAGAACGCDLRIPPPMPGLTAQLVRFCHRVSACVMQAAPRLSGRHHSAPYPKSESEPGRRGSDHSCFFVHLRVLIVPEAEDIS